MHLALKTGQSFVRCSEGRSSRAKPRLLGQRHEHNTASRWACISREAEEMYARLALWSRFLPPARPMSSPPCRLLPIGSATYGVQTWARYTPKLVSGGSMFRSSRRKIWHESLRDLLWPRIGVRRAWNYRICRLSRLRVCPHKISLGFALGAFASFTPFIGFHFLLAAVLAFVLRGNLLASAAGTVVGNPLTFPLIWIATFKLGNALTGGAGH